MKRPLTIICDIDGTILMHYGDLTSQISKPPILLPEVKNKFSDWDKKGYKIILITGRRESSRKITEEQLQSVGIFYDELIMGVGGGTRVLINDLKPETEFDTALAYNVKRNNGLGDINV